MWDLKSLNPGGDPAIPVWLKTPMAIIADYPSVVTCPNSFTITVETQGGVGIAGVRPTVDLPLDLQLVCNASGRLPKDTRSQIVQLVLKVLE